MTTTTWSSPVSKFKHLCVNDLRVEAIPNSVQLDTCNVCVAPQYVVSGGTPGCHICKSIPQFVNVILEQPLGDFTGGAPITQSVEYRQLWQSLIDGGQQTSVTRHEVLWHFYPTPGNTIFRLKPFTTDKSWPTGTWNYRISGCFRQWTRGELFHQMSLPAREAPLQTVSWRRPAPGQQWVDVQRGFPSGPSTVGPFVRTASKRYSDLVRLDNGGLFDGIHTPYTNERITLGIDWDYFTGFSLLGSPSPVPEFAQLKTDIDDDQLTPPTDARNVVFDKVKRSTGISWVLRAGDGYDPLDRRSTARWRASKNITVKLLAAVGVESRWALNNVWSPHFWQIPPEWIDLTGQRPGTWPRYYTFAQFPSWSGPFVQYTPGTRPIEFHGSPSAMWTAPETVTGPPYYITQQLTGPGHVTSLVPPPGPWANPLTGAAGYTGTQNVVIGQWTGLVDCDTPMPAMLTGGAVYPGRFGGPKNIPNRIFVDIGQLP